MLSRRSRAVIGLLLPRTSWCVVAHLFLMMSTLLTAPLNAAGTLAHPAREVMNSDETSPHPEHDLLIPSVAAVPALEPSLTLQTSFQAKPPRLTRRLLNLGDQRISWHVSADASPADIEVVNEGALLAAFPDPNTQMSTLTDWYYRFRINYAQPWERSRYGMEYRYVGDDYDPTQHSTLKPDQGLVEFWGKWQFGVTRLRTSLSQEWNNVDLEPARSRLTTMRGQLQLEIALPAWPLLLLSYTGGPTWSSWRPKGSGDQKYGVDVWEATLYYERPTWQTTLASTYSQSRDQLTSIPPTLYLYHELSLIYHLTSQLSLAPAMRMSQHQSATSGGWTDTPEVALSVYYQRLFEAVDVAADSAYTHSYSHDNAWETHTIDTVVSLKWHFNLFRFGPATMAFEVSYMNYTDADFPSNSFMAFTGGWSIEMTF